MDHQDRLSALERVPLLAGLSGASLERVARDCRWRQFDPGEQLVDYQDASTEVFFLIEGKLRVVYSVDGKAVLFTDLQPGAMFGEIAAIDRAGRSAGVEALGRSTVASLEADQFEALLLREPQLALATLKHVAAEVRRLSERVVEFSTLVVQNRIQAELLQLVAESGRHEEQAPLASARAALLTLSDPRIFPQTWGKPAIVLAQSVIAIRRSVRRQALLSAAAAWAHYLA